MSIRKEEIETTQSYWSDIWQEAQGSPPWRSPQADQDFHDNLLTFAPSHLLDKTDKKQPKRALLPLCGNSPIVKLLRDLEFEVTGVEFVEQAIKSLFAEHFRDEIFQIQPTANGRVFSAFNINIFQQDFFTFSPSSSFSLIYDRAALIAIKPDYQPAYVEIVKNALESKGVLYIDSFDTPDHTSVTPPYSISPDSLLAIFSSLKSIYQATEPFEPKGGALRQRGVKTANRTITIFQKQ